MKSTRFAIATFLAPVAALIGPVLLAVIFSMSEKSSESVLLPDGSFDDGPMRMVGIFFVVLLPILYIAAAILYASVGLLLGRIGRRTLKANIGATCVPVLVVVSIALFKRLEIDPSQLHSMLTIAIISFVASIFAAVGSTTWWFIAARREPPNPSIERDVQELSLLAAPHVKR